MKRLLSVMFGCLCLLFGCAPGTVEGETELSSVVTCTVSEVRYPTSVSDFGHVYNGRGFLTDHNHLGYDIALAEGTAIHPIACGTLRIYRPATGYGTLVAVIEHQLARPITVVNGAGRSVSISSFLSIYGHIRPSSLEGGAGNVLSYSVGTTVRPSDTIGYIENDEENGDGAEHLHLGLRLQTATAAQAVDPRAWFRGYDGTPSMAAYYANAAVMLPQLLSSTPVTTPVDAGSSSRCTSGATNAPDSYCANTYCPSRGSVADHLVCNSLGNWDCVCRTGSDTPDAGTAPSQHCVPGAYGSPDAYCYFTYCPARHMSAAYLSCNVLGNWDCICY